MKQEWILMIKQADFAGLSAKFGVPPLLIKLMINRGIGEEEMETFLHGGMNGLHDASLMKDIDKACDMLAAIAEKHEQIAIVSDYDCDGIFSGMILYTGLEKMGAKPIIYTPDRITEGYGINKRIIDSIYNSGINYIITCDNGIAAYDEVAYAKSLGIEVIITDHHEIPYNETEGNREYIIPPADAVCNPKQPDCEYPYKGLCGGGVAYKLITCLFEKLHINDVVTQDILLQYAAIATVADVMELTGENRIIVKEGLKRLSNDGDRTTCGLKAIKKVNDLMNKQIGTYHIGFVIGPCFNAAGRIETAKTSFDLLLAKDDESAMSLAYHLKDVNNERKEMTERAAARGMELVDGEDYKDDKVIVLLLEDCHESIAGIVAGRIKESLCKPVFVFTNTDEGLCKGSGRSIESYHMYDELVKCADLFTRFGGHAMAAGITIPAENLPELRRRLNENTVLTEKDFVSKIYVDAEVLFRHMSEPVIKSLGLLEPCGNGNKKPLFAASHVAIRRARIIGKNKNILKMELVDRLGSVLDGICFNDAQDLLEMIESEYGKEQTSNMLNGRPNNVDIAITFYPDINEYNGKKSIQLIIQNYNVIK